MPCLCNDRLKLVERTIKQIRIAYRGALCVKARVIALDLHLMVDECATHSGWLPWFTLRSDDSVLRKTYALMIARKRCQIGAHARPR